MAEQQLTNQNQKEKRTGLAQASLVILPLIVLAIVIWVFLKTNGGLALTSPAPVEGLTFERTVLEPGKIILTVRNAGPQELHLAQVVVNDGVWPFKTFAERNIPRLGTAKVEIDYAWNYAEAYDVTLFSSNSIAFNTQIPVAFQTPELGGGTLLSFTLIGLYVGVIPVFLGFFWLPALRRLGKRWMTFLLAVTAGLLIFLGVDTLVEGLELVPRIAGALQGSGLIAIGVVVSFALLFAISRRQSGIGRSETDQRLSLAYMIALGIGVHNLGEGLAIGAAYSIGEIALGRSWSSDSSSRISPRGWKSLPRSPASRPTSGTCCCWGYWAVDRRSSEPGLAGLPPRR